MEYAVKSRTLRSDGLLRILALPLTDYKILGLLLTFPDSGIITDLPSRIVEN